MLLLTRVPVIYSDTNFMEMFLSFELYLLSSAEVTV